MASRELLRFSLTPPDDGDSEELLVYTSIELKDLKHLLSGESFGEVSGVTFLPHEFT